jgi:exopolysaccharide biosynthesis protein
VQNASAQLNGALAASNTFKRLPADVILSNEIKANGYQNKCMVAINASFFSYSTNSPVSPVVINKGKIVKNEGNAGGCVGVDSNNKLIECSHKDANWIARKGVRNTFGISSSASASSGGPTASRTQICQIDENNFVLISGSGTVGGVANKARNITGCGEVYNLDGGGSRKLYYKNKSSSTPIKVFGGSREVPDMLYFAEE